MAKKNFWFKFEFAAWRNDLALRRCSLETRGFWLECICLMEDAEVCELEGTPAELANLIGCSKAVFNRCVAELDVTNAASVSKSQGFVKIVSRRKLKAVSVKEYNRLKQRESRERRNVKAVSNDSSKDIEIKSLRAKREEQEKEVSNDTSKKPDVPEPVVEAIRTTETLTGVLAELGLKKLSNSDAREWTHYSALAYENDFTVDQFLECLALLRKQHWRTSAVRAKHVFENLPNLEKIRDEVTNGNGNSSNANKQNHRTDADKLRDAATAIASKYS